VTCSVYITHSLITSSSILLSHLHNQKQTQSIHFIKDVLTNFANVLHSFLVMTKINK